MNKCDCRNSKTREPKECYADEAGALAACGAHKNEIRDGDALRVYYCNPGECWHIGNSGMTTWEQVANKKRGY